MTQILASDALLDALPQRTLDRTFRVPLEPDSGVIASEYVQGIAVSDYTVLRFLTHNVELHAILLEVINDECVTLIEHQLKAVDSQKFAVFCLGQHQLVTSTPGLVRKGMPLFQKSAYKFFAGCLIKDCLGNTPSVKPTLLEHTNCPFAPSSLRKWEEVHDDLEWSPVVDADSTVAFLWFDDGNSEELVAKRNSIDEELSVLGRRVLLLVPYSHDPILLGCHDIAEGASKVKLCLLFLVQTVE